MNFYISWRSGRLNNRDYRPIEPGQQVYAAGNSHRFGVHDKDLGDIEVDAPAGGFTLSNKADASEVYDRGKELLRSYIIK